jgi:glycosyltransferase involved in cell wall biosynthesis
MTMKIAVIAPTEIPALRANTIQVMKMSHALARLGHEVRLAIPDSKPQELGDDQTRRSWAYLAHHYGLQTEFEMVWLHSSPRLRRYDYSLKAVRWAKSWQSDLSYTRLPQAAAIASWMGSPTLLEMHDIPQGVVGPWLFDEFLNGSGARRVVAITQALADDISRRFPDSPIGSLLLVAPDGVDLDRYVDLPAPVEARLMLQAQHGLPSSLEPESFTAGYTGHLYPGRGCELMLELARLLPEIHFLLVGGEPEQVQQYSQQARLDGLENLILTGFVPNADLPLYQAACDILLMPYQQKVEASSGGDISRYLSPMKLFEYLACGRPIISSDLAVFSEVLNTQNALLVSPVQPQAWKEAILALQNDPALVHRLSHRARQDAQRYTWEARAGRILEGIMA